MTEQTDTEPRQPAYAAVYAYIRELPGDPHSYESVCRNAAIWKAVHAALDAAEAPSDAELVEAQRLARAWEEKYFEMAEKRTADAVALGRVRAFAEDMRTWCSPRNVAADYADRLLGVLNGEVDG
jgi:hypothetical protein